MKPQHALAVMLVLVAGGCATTSGGPEKRFQTLDNTSPISDFDAASYYGVVIDAERLGEVAVWSNGVFTIDANGERIPVLELTVLARNESQTPFELDLDTTSVTLTHVTTATLSEEYAVAGTRRVAPGETRRVGIRYRLPSMRDLTTLSSFDFTWTMRAASSGFSQLTPFRFLTTGQFELGAEWPQLKRVSYTQDNRRPWSIRWSAVTPEPGDPRVRPGDDPPAFKWSTPPAKTEEAPQG
ncbi:MAG: hypothetical protein ACAI38_16885 [Myxococcota bacterium]